MAKVAIIGVTDLARGLRHWWDMATSLACGSVSSLTRSLAMLAFMWWMVIGLVAGLLARVLVPGRQPMGFLLTMLLGMAGSLVGGFISSAVFGYSPGDPNIHAGGLFLATGGAMLLLVIYLSVNRSSRIDPRL